MSKVLIPGSFDPITNGHMDIITRASRMCEELVVAVMHNPDKKGFLPAQKRVELIEKACASLSNVRVIAHGGLLIECAAQEKADAVVLNPPGVCVDLNDFTAHFQSSGILFRQNTLRASLFPLSVRMLFSMK